MDETCLIELVRDIPSFGDQSHQKGHKRALKLKRDEIQEKLNFTGKYWNNNTIELQYGTNFKQRLLIHQQKCVPTVIIRRLHHVPFTSPTTRRLRKRSPSVGRNLFIHVGFKVAIHIWRCMPRQMLVCCVVSVLAPA